MQITPLYLTNNPEHISVAEGNTEKRPNTASGQSHASFVIASVLALML
jgi:hypothetical protein